VRRLSLLLAADVAVFLLAAVAFAVQLPSNVDDPDQSPLYLAAFWVAVAALGLLAILLAIIAVRLLWARLR
jgi:hypothetical protein